MDGLIIGGHYMAALHTGRVPELLETFHTAARQAGGGEDFPRVAEIKISLSKNRRLARE